MDKKFLKIKFINNYGYKIFAELEYKTYSQVCMTDSSVAYYLNIKYGEYIDLLKRFNGITNNVDKEIYFDKKIDAELIIEDGIDSLLVYKKIIER